MPKINTLPKLIAFISALAIAFFNVIPWYKAVVMVVISDNVTATRYITPIVDWITQWAVIITIAIIIGLLIFGIANYIINRRKLDKPSDEVQAIKSLSKQLVQKDESLINEIKGLREDLRNKGGQNDESK